MLAKLPMHATTRCGLSTVTSAPVSSVSVTAPACEACPASACGAPDPASGAGWEVEQPASSIEAARDVATAAGTMRWETSFMGDPFDEMS